MVGGETSPTSLAMDLYHTPALAPPPHTVPNFINPQSQALMVIVSSIICLALIIPVALLRFYTNLWIKKSPKVDEIVCAFAAAGCVAYTAVVLSCRHQWDVPILPNVPAYLRKMIIVVDLMYGPIAFCAKLTLFLLYYRLFGRHRWLRYLVYIGIGIAAAQYTAGAVVYGYLCLPRSGESWIEAGLSSRCHKQFIMSCYVRGPINVLNDLLILLMPLPAVWQLQLPLRKRLGITGIFFTGALTQDLTWNLAPVLTALVIELNVGTICACLPSLAVFYRHHRLKPGQVATLKTFTNKLVPSSRKSKQDRLETRILGSVKGDGNFLKSGDLTDINTSTDTTHVEGAQRQGYRPPRNKGHSYCETEMLDIPHRHGRLN
ncbi:MAG: hypothetical protein Q9218_007442 [Villophora microphyllina]